VHEQNEFRVKFAVPGLIFEVRIGVILIPLLKLRGRVLKGLNSQGIYLEIL
jgi:hypothetical protein